MWNNTGAGADDEVGRHTPTSKRCPSGVEYDVVVSGGPAFVDPSASALTGFTDPPAPATCPQNTTISTASSCPL